jgi:16S rRNA (cytidine1402-2'-O)-methyltransferase
MVADEKKPGILYVVATPIGNLDDCSPRARQVLRTVDRVAAEDTRHSARLLSHFRITVPCTALHEHNEREQAGWFVECLCAGQSIALISDAGTPLISDPGFRLVRAAAAAGVVVRPVPGPSAVVAALSAAGLPTDRFIFEGFPPARATARRACLARFARETRTTVFYESSHRVRALLGDAALVLADRQWVLARELTKRHEQWARGGAEALLAWLDSDSDRLRGEFVLLLAGAEVSAEQERNVAIGINDLLRELLAELPLKTAVALAARLSGQGKNALYARALKLNG